MSRSNLEGVVHPSSFPRVSGDEPVKGLQGLGPRLFSPRERG